MKGIFTRHARQIRVSSIESLSQTVESTVSCRSIVGTQAIVRGPKDCSGVKGINNRMGLEAVAPRQGGLGVWGGHK